MSNMRAAIAHLLCKQFGYIYFYDDGNKSITTQMKALMMDVPVCIFH